MKETVDKTGPRKQLLMKLKIWFPQNFQSQTSGGGCASPNVVNNMSSGSTSPTASRVDESPGSAMVQVDQESLLVSLMHFVFFFCILRLQ